MGNSASALPYTIGKETHSASRPNSCGFSIHAGERKSDQQPVTVFKGEKSVMVKTPISASSAAAATKNMLSPPSMQLHPALHHFKKCKTLIHPYILSVYATLDTDYPDKKDSNAFRSSGSQSAAESSASSLFPSDQTLTTGDLIIVTEKVMPLEDYLNLLKNDVEMTDSQRADCVAWGIYNLIQAVHFLHTHAKVAHGNLIIDSVYVTPGGDFKLSSFFILTPVGASDANGSNNSTGLTEHFRRFEKDITPEQYRSPERIEGRYDAIASSPIHTMDSYSFGVLLSEIYRHLGAGTSSLLPDKLEKACARLRTASLARPRIIPLSKCPIFSSKHVQAQKFMDEIATQPIEDKIAFWKSLPDLFTQRVLSSRVAKHKVLPLLHRTLQTLTSVDAGLTQDISKRECLALLPTLFATATTHLSKAEFQSQLEPVIEILFKVNDRAVRGAMLGKIPMLVEYLDGPSLNRVVFEPMCSGFTDSSGPLRELTLKSAVVLVSYLTQPNLEKLTRYLVRLQSDPEDSIRTNTVIFIGKVAPSLSDIARSKLILPAFMRAMADSFVPCRLAGLKAICASRSLFEEKRLASEVLPAIAPSLADASSEVRDAAIKAVDDLLIILREHSEVMRREEEIKQQQYLQSQSVVPGEGTIGHSINGSTSKLASEATSKASSSSSSYLSGLSSWASSKLTSSAQAAHVPNMDIRSGESTIQSSKSTSSLGHSSTLKLEPLSNSRSASSFNNNTGFDDVLDSEAKADTGGWSDDDFDDMDVKPKNIVNGRKSLIDTAPVGVNQDDFMAQFDKMTTIRPRITANSKLQVPSGRLGGVSRSRKSDPISVRKEEKTTKPTIQKLNLDDDPIGDGWDDF